MATFTIVLKDIEDAVRTGPLTKYPIFDEKYRSTLNDKIIDHFYNREIGQETVDMFMLALRRKMNEIMPLHNQMYKSQALEIDPLITFRTTQRVESSGTNEATTTGTSHASNESATDATSSTVGSEFPQNRLADDENYATTRQDAGSKSVATATTEGSENGSQVGSQTGESVTTSEGYTGSPADLLLRYRETFVNIDLAILNELEGLFMLVWDNGDEYSKPGTLAGLFPRYLSGWF